MKRAFAATLGVSTSTLARWDHLPGLMDEVRNLVQFHIGDRLPGILHAVANQAEQGHIPSARLILGILGYFQPQQMAVAVEVTGDDVAAMAAQVQAYLAKVEDEDYDDDI